MLELLPPDFKNIPSWERNPGGDLLDPRSRVLSLIDDSSNDMIELARCLIRIPTDLPPGKYEEATAFLIDRLRELELEPQRIEVPSSKVKEMGLETPRINLLSKVKGLEGKPRLILNAHIDSVPPGNEWTVNPYGAEIIGDRLYGKGAAACKADVAAYAYALNAIKKSGINLQGDCAFAVTVDEEIGGDLGIRYLLDQGLIEADYAITEGWTYVAWNAVKGCLWWNIETIGKPVHASAADMGVNAIEMMSAVISGLLAYRGKIAEKKSVVEGMGTPKLTVSTIRGGSTINMVADRCVVTVDRRIIPEEDIGRVEEEMLGVVEESLRAFKGGKFRIETKLRATPAVQSGRDSELLKVLKRNAKEVLGEEIQIIGLPVFADLRHFVERGIPSVMYGVGPKSFQAPGLPGPKQDLPVDDVPDENVPLEDIIKTAKVIALTVIHLLS